MITSHLPLKASTQVVLLGFMGRAICSNREIGLFWTKVRLMVMMKASLVVRQSFSRIGSPLFLNTVIHIAVIC